MAGGLCGTEMIPVSAECVWTSDRTRFFDSVTPTGAIPIAETLDKLLKSYFSELEKAKAAHREDSVKPINYIVLTDGAPSKPLFAKCSFGNN